jgi:molybdopterin-guanine dinucleotide biosynthesis adapter protein
MTNLARLNLRGRVGRNVLGAPVFGIVGWKNSGKTTLTVALVSEFTRRGLVVATIKHAHHNFQIDDANTDSARHRRAGAAQVAIVSRDRWAMVRELKGQDEPDLVHMVTMLEPCDLIVVEGYKAAAIPKIEVRRLGGQSREVLSAHDPHVLAIAADHAVAGAQVPVFALDDVAVIADFITHSIGPLGAG